MKRYKVLGELVTFKSTTGRHLDGILYQSDSNKTTILHVHGSFGNFYQNQFVRQMALAYLGNSINFLSFNLSSHDGLAEGYSHENEFAYTGGALADFEECIGDIKGAIEFTQPFSKRVILQGHSLGCDRILHFLISTQAKYDFILLSPCDSFQLQSNWIAPQAVQVQIQRLRAKGQRLADLEWVSTNEYGIKQGTWVYPIPITRKALISILDGPPLKLLNIENPYNFFIDQDALVVIGGKDELQTSRSEVMFEYLQKRVRKLSKAYFPIGDHFLAGCEEEVIAVIIEWANVKPHNR